ncbi:hypothetical protein OS493_013123 [Desmophyllum pertusum]|uniref:F-box domain-containing protein n=1 Tax=Desmophyllum pertusum TaxID=174260 RepID=A0A9X0CL60_9CNID|nr:hypothetical protein OS493_013123 [Desmophyllum pertusum]
MHKLKSKLKSGKLFGRSKREKPSLEILDDLSLSHIASFLDPEDIVRLGRTSRRMHSLMPRVMAWKGEDFSIFGPGGGHWAPTAPGFYFDGPILPSTVQELNMDVVWQDQGWGNRKGELYMTLMRPTVEGRTSSDRRTSKIVWHCRALRNSGT